MDDSPDPFIRWQNLMADADKAMVQDNLLYARLLRSEAQAIREAYPQFFTQCRGENAGT